MPDSALHASDTRLRAEALLRAAGVRVTLARVSVLATLLQAPNALTHEELNAALRGMDRVTLYRSLDCLIDAGLAHRITGEGRSARYGAGVAQVEQSFAGIRHRHGHFRCVRCSKVFCLEHAPEQHLAMQPVLETALQALGDGFFVRDLELTFNGWCADCAR